MAFTSPGANALIVLLHFYLFSLDNIFLIFLCLKLWKNLIKQKYFFFCSQDKSKTHFLGFKMFYTYKGPKIIFKYNINLSNDKDIY